MLIISPDNQSVPFIFSNQLSALQRYLIDYDTNQRKAVNLHISEARTIKCLGDDSFIKVVAIKCSNCT